MKLTHKNLFLSAITVALTTSSAQAVDHYWRGETGNWNTVGDWSSTVDGTGAGVVPNSTTAANLFFNITSKNSASSDISNGNAARNAASLTFNTSGNTGMRAGGADTANSTLNLGAGGVTLGATSGNVTLGQTPASFGTLTVALSANQIWTNNNAAKSLTVAGAVTGASRQLTKSGAGIVRLNGLNTYSGATIINNGVLQIGSYDGLDNTSSITVSGGGTSNLALVQVGTGTTANSINKSLSLHGTLSTAGGSGSNLLNQTWAGDITLAGNSTITNNGNSTFVISGKVDTTITGHTLTFQTDRDGSSITGKITGAGGLTKTGIRDLLLTNATNDYTGTTTGSAGALIASSAAALPGYNLAGKVVFNDGSIGGRIGGAGWTTGEIDTLLSSATKTSGALAIDTTNGSLTQWTTFTPANLGPLGLTKAGSNTLILDQANTYTGPTLVLGGTLRFANTTAAATSSSVSTSGTGTLQVANDSASSFTFTALNILGGTISSDRATPGAGLTHILGNAAVNNATHNFTKGANVTSGNAAIQLGNLTNSSGADGSATFNPTTANLIIAGGYTGAVNAGANTLILSGSAATNSLTGDVTLGTRTNINVTKSGSSVWTLSGNNSVSLGAGSTLSVSAGALIVTTAAALPGTATVIFGGGTIGAQVGGAGLTTAELDGFLAAGSTTKTSGAIGIDTTNGNLTQWTDFTTTNLGPALGLTKLGVNTLTLNSAGNNYTGTTLVSQGTLEMTVDHTLTGGLTFGYANGTTSATGILDLNAVNATFGALNVDGNSPTAYEIQIDSGKTLTVSGAVQIGASAPAVTGTVTKLNMTGGGAFVHNGTTFLVGGTAAGAGILQDATLDLRGLSSAAITTTGNFRVAPNTGTNNGSSATMFLPTPVVADTVATTTITSNGTNGISVGNSGAFSSASSMIDTLQLGTGLTTLNAVKVNVGAEQVTGNLRDIGQLIYGQAAGDLIIRGANGTDAVTSFNLGTGPPSTGSTSANPTLFDSSGHDADILVTTLNIGSYIRTAAAQTYQFKFGEGNNSLTGGFSSKLDVTNVNIGDRAAGTSSTITNTSKLDISGGTVLLGNVGATGTGVNLGNSAYNQAGAATFNSELNISGGTTTIHNSTSMTAAVRLGQSTAVNSGTVNASMNLTGGTTTLTGDIVKGTATGTVNSTLKLAGGTLDMGGNDIGSAGAGTVTLTAESGTLSNIATINGTGGLTKTTANTLIVSGTIAYTGDTTVSDGTLRQSSVNAANEGSTVSIAATATLDLTYAGTDTVDKLFIGGVQQPMGIYGPTATAIPGRITNSSGSGTLTVLSNPPGGYSAWASINSASPTDLSADQDNDGVDNGTEYFIGGTTLPQANTTGFTPLPTVVNTAGVLSVTWVKAASYIGTYGIDFAVETSATLTGVWATETSGVTVTFPSATEVKYTFPAGTKNFARLKVTGP